MVKGIALLGSTGSIGRQTLDVAGRLSLKVSSLAAYKNVELIEAQARRFSPKVVSMGDKGAAAELKIKLADTSVRVSDDPCDAASVDSADTAVAAMSGVAGLIPTVAAIESGKNIALANKETLVVGGDAVTGLARKKGVRLLPVDSEHSAIFQCLNQMGDNPLKRIILTASGGPFFGKDGDFLKTVTPEMALKHPNWSMGAKVTVDSSTMANKGLELIEAMRLFNADPDDIEICVHRQSIVHSMVEFCDGAVIAQLGLPDMRLPILYALSYPDRVDAELPRLNISDMASLTFEKPNEEVFPATAIARRAAKEGKTAIFNGADEAAVAAFLEGKLSFCGISELLGLAVESLPTPDGESISELLAADRAGREFVSERVG